MGVLFISQHNPLLQTALTVMHKLNGKMMPNTNPPVRCLGGVYLQCVTMRGTPQSPKTSGDIPKRTEFSFVHAQRV